MLRTLFFCFFGLVFSLCAGQKVVLLNDTTSHYSWGCTGTSVALKERIEALGFELQAIPIVVSYTLKEVPPFERFDDRPLFERFCEANPDTVKALREASAVIINGEGTTHDVRPAPRNLLYVAHASKIFLGKHVEMINHSAYPKDDPLLVGGKEDQEQRQQAQAAYKKVYAELDYVAIREPFSQKEMNALEIASTLSFDCLPLYIKDHYRKEKQVKEKQIVLSGSVAFTQKGALKTCRYMESMHKRGFALEVLVGAMAFPAQDEEAFVQFLKKHCKAPFQVVNAASMDEWLETIQQAALFVSGRFHHSIAAFCLNTPFIALNSNTHKMHGICALMGQPAPLLYNDAHLLKQLLTRTDTLLTAPALDNSAKIEELCQLAERNFDELRALKTDAAGDFQVLAGDVARGEEEGDGLRDLGEMAGSAERDGRLLGQVDRSL